MRILPVIIFLFLAGPPLLARPDSVAVKSPGSSEQTQSKPTICWPALLVPGAVQIQQNRLAPATLYYFSAATFYYRAAFNFSRYEVTRDDKFLRRFQGDLSVAGLLHLSSTLDAVYARHLGIDRPWNSDPFSPVPLKSPWAASLRSAILPGWGQVYNGSILKAVVYLSIDGYFFYKAREADELYKISGKDRDREERSKYNWYFGLAYLMTMIDAHVDAYLYGFEKTMELTMEPGFDGQGLLLGISYTF